MTEEKPLVSILIPNYNHARYLIQCIDSAFSQTYSNVEVILLDNGSSDDSLEIASKYIIKGLKINSNPMNLMNASYMVLTNELCSGKYFILLCADDYIAPDFIEKSVDIMEKYPNIGYVHGERDFVLEDGTILACDPFYKCSFIAPGKNTMPVYMITPVAHPAQGVIRVEAFRKMGGYDMEINHLNADRSMWFYLSYYYDMAYIREKMSHIRISQQTETVITQTNFQHPVLCHLTILDYFYFAKEKNLPEVYNRKAEALERLSNEFLEYAIGMLYVGDIDLAKAYIQYSYIINRDIVTMDKYIRLMKMCETKIIDKQYIDNSVNGKYLHKRGYEPPKGYEEIFGGRCL